MVFSLTAPRAFTFSKSSRSRSASTCFLAAVASCSPRFAAASRRALSSSRRRVKLDTRSTPATSTHWR